MPATRRRKGRGGTNHDLNAKLHPVRAGKRPSRLFARASGHPGGRPAWGPPDLPGNTGAIVPGLVNGSPAGIRLSAFDAWQGTEFVRTGWALLDFRDGTLRVRDAELTGDVDLPFVLAD